MLCSHFFGGKKLSSLFQAGIALSNPPLYLPPVQSRDSLCLLNPHKQGENEQSYKGRDGDQPPASPLARRASSSAPQKAHAGATRRI